MYVSVFIVESDNYEFIEFTRSRMREIYKFRIHIHYPNDLTRYISLLNTSLTNN